MFKALALENFWAPAFAGSKHRVIKKQAAGLWRIWLSAALIAANGLLLMSYIYGVNEFASQGYQIKTLQAQIAALGEDNKKITLKVSEAGSMVAIQNDFLSSNFVPAGTAKFLAPSQFTQR